MSESSENFPKTSDDISHLISKREAAIKANSHLFPIDESEDFYDPFSDLSIFLAKKIKNEILKDSSAKKWSRDLQSNILRSILPDFQRTFPQYRLGVNALKKTWEKVKHYHSLIEHEKQAYTDVGKLNVPFMIKENIRNYTKTPTDTLHPYNAAHNLAVKISECIATIDGEKPRLDELTKQIWAVQKHVIAPSKGHKNSPFDNFDTLDKLILRYMLEATSEEPYLKKAELAKRVHERIHSITKLHRIKNLGDLSPYLSAKLASKVYPTIMIHQTRDTDELEQIREFIKQQMHNYFGKSRHIDPSECVALSRRILFVYKMAISLPKERAKKGLESALEYVYSLSTNAFNTNQPPLKQEIYHFIHAEITSIKKTRSLDPLKSIMTTLMDMFQDAESLPKLSNDEYECLEVIIWDVFQSELSFLRKIPVYLQDVLYEELAGVHIDSLQQSFSCIIDRSINFLKNIREISLEKLDEKVTFWTLQNDMAASSLSFSPDTPILKVIHRMFNQKHDLINHEEFVDEVLQKYIAAHPALKGWRQQVRRRITILYKYYWYNLVKQSGETNFDSFLKWHFHAICNGSQQIFPEVTFTELESITSNLLPLTPYNKDHTRKLIKELEAPRTA